MATRNEFLRSRPSQRTRNVLYDLSNLVILVLVIIIGIILFAQTFARLTGYDPDYTDKPVLVTQKAFLGIPAGYPFYNPGVIAVTIASKPFDKTVNAILFPSLFPLTVCTGIAVMLFFIVSFVRGYGLNRSDNLYGTARWGNENDGLYFRYSKLLFSNELLSFRLLNSSTETKRQPSFFS